MLLSCGKGLEVVAQICYLRAGEAEVGVCYKKPGLHSKCPASLCYCLNDAPFEYQNRASEMAQHFSILACRA